MRLLLLRFNAEIGSRALHFCSRAPRAVVSLRPEREGRRRRRNKRRRVPFRVPTFVLVAQRRRRWSGPPAGTPGIATLVLNGALTRV
jgi:hypothetical protein